MYVCLMQYICKIIEKNPLFLPNTKFTSDQSELDLIVIYVLLMNPQLNYSGDYWGGNSSMGVSHALSH